MKTTPISDVFGSPHKPVVDAPKKRSKYNAIPTIVDGIRFASKAEARYYEGIKFDRFGGLVENFLRQVPFYLDGGDKYVCDFMVIYTDGRIEFVDVKGFETAMFRNKKKRVERQYAPIKIKVVK